MAEKPQLLIGWAPDKAAHVDADAPIPPDQCSRMFLQGEGLRSHMAIIGQSGSGKSFTLGRLLEEIVSRTSGRVAIFDPNSDFVRFSEVDETKWRQSEIGDRFAKQDTRTEFVRRWEANSFRVLTGRQELERELSHKYVRCLPISASWERLDSLTQAAYLGFSATSAPGEAMVIQWLHFFGEGANRLYDLYIQTLRLASGRLPATLERMMKDSDVEHVARLVPFQGAVGVHARCGELRELGMWDVGGDRSLGDVFVVLGRREPGEGGYSVCLDLGSLEKSEAVLMTTHVALNNLWRGSRAAWVEALRQPEEYDERPPVFVVIDEAHNLCPREPRTLAARLVRDAIARIATEGRKLGLFLILATQRPGLVDQTVLSQCDSLCLHRLNNQRDADHVIETFGFLSARSEEVAKLRKGEALMAGHFVQGTDTARVTIAPRRTKEGGRSIGKGWLRDPSPKLDP